MREGTLDRLIRIGLAAVAIGVALEVSNYFLNWRGGGGPSLLERRIAAIEDAVRDDPSQIAPRLQLAEAYRAADEPDSALRQYDEVLKLEPDMSTALLGRGEILAEEGEGSEAAEAFKKLIANAGGAEFSAVDPQLEAAYYGLGSVLLEQGEASKAMHAARQAVEVEPTDADAWYLLGAAALEAGSPGRAVEALRQAVMFVPTGWCEPYERLSEAYGALDRGPHAEYASAMVDLCEGRPADAAGRLEPLTSGPVRVDAMLGLGMAAELESDPAAARRWYRRVIAAEPDNFNARSGLNRLGSAPASQPGHAAIGDV